MNGHTTTNVWKFKKGNHAPGGVRSHLAPLSFSPKEKIDLKSPTKSMMFPPESWIITKHTIAHLKVYYRSYNSLPSGDEKQQILRPTQIPIDKTNNYNNKFKKITPQTIQEGEAQATCPYPRSYPTPKKSYPFYFSTNSPSEFITAKQLYYFNPYVLIPTKLNISRTIIKPKSPC